MTLTKDFDGPHGSMRIIVTAGTGEQEVYAGREASAIQALLARKVDPDVVLDRLVKRR